MTASISLRQVIRAGGFVALVALLSACGGLSAEPKTVSTLIPPTSPSNPVAPTSPAVSVPVTPVGATPATVQTEQATKPAAGVVKTEEVAPVLGTVTGHVSNATSGGTVPPGLKVTLHVVDTNTNIGETTVDKVIDANGDYVFTDVPIKAGASYGVSTMYQNRQLVSDVATGDPAVKSMALPLKLYEITSDPSVISIASMIIRANGTAEGLQVAEVIQFKNSSDRVYSSEKPINGDSYGSVTVSLPKGAVLMGFANDSNRFVMGSDGSSFTDTLPVVPSEDHVIHFVYSLPYRSDGTSVEMPIAYPVNGTIQLLLDPATLSATSPQLPPLGSQTMGTSTFQAYGGQISMKAGDALKFVVSGGVDGSASTSSGSSPIAGRELLIGLLIGMGSTAILAGVILLVRDRVRDNRPARPRRASEPETESSKVSLKDDEKVEALIAQLAQLDEQHEHGRISSTAYNRKRAALKARLAELMKE